MELVWKKDLHTELDELNKQIKNMEDHQVLARTNLAIGEERHANEKVLLMNKIAMEKDDKGKPMFSNETKRQAQYNRLMIVGHPLHTLNAQLKDDRTELEYSFNELGFLKRKFQILLLIRLGGKENERE